MRTTASDTKWLYMPFNPRVQVTIYGKEWVLMGSHGFSWVWKGMGIHGTPWEAP